MALSKGVFCDFDDDDDDDDEIYIVVVDMFSRMSVLGLCCREF